MTPSEAKELPTGTTSNMSSHSSSISTERPKPSRCPVDHFEDILTTGAGFAGFAIWGMGIEPHGPGLHGRGRSGHAVAGAMATRLRAHCLRRTRAQDEPWDIDARVALKKQLKRLAAQGTDFLYRSRTRVFAAAKGQPTAGSFRAMTTDTLAKPCYDYKGLSRARAFLEKLTDSMKAVGIDVYQIDHEDANGQFEINYTFNDCLSSCDHYMFFKMAASEIANEHGPDLLVHAQAVRQSSRQRHAHAHVAGRRQKEPVHDKSDRAGMDLSKLAYQFMAGLLKHAPALAAICAPTVNSYKRLVVGRSLDRRDLGAGLHQLRRQQPLVDGAHPRRPSRTAPARWRLQPLPRHRCRDRGGPGRHR